MPSGGINKLLFESLLTDVDSTATENVGQLRADESGNIYIYLKGVANVALGWVVTYVPTTKAGPACIEIAGGAVGMVAVAMAAIVANKFGWFQIDGLNLKTKCDGSAAVGAAYIGGTTGGVDNNVVVGDLISGMFITVADSSNLCGVYMHYPHVTDESN